MASLLDERLVQGPEQRGEESEGGLQCAGGARGTFEDRRQGRLVLAEDERGRQGATTPECRDRLLVWATLRADFSSSPRVVLLSCPTTFPLVQFQGCDWLARILCSLPLATIVTRFDPTTLVQETRCSPSSLSPPSFVSLPPSRVLCGPARLTVLPQPSPLPALSSSPMPSFIANSRCFRSQSVPSRRPRPPTSRTCSDTLRPRARAPVMPVRLRT